MFGRFGGPPRWRGSGYGFAGWGRWRPQQRFGGRSWGGWQSYPRFSPWADYGFGGWRRW
jgi:hypothetical protein